MSTLHRSDRRTADRWAPYLDRYRRGEWRATVFRDLLLDEAHQLGDDLTFLDIGCGSGFDDDVSLQTEVAAAAHRYIGIEPDAEVTVGEHVGELHRCLFEDAPLPPGSVDLAFAIMVLEHLPQPQRFWDKLWNVLRDGGVFWGLTVDGRHFVAHASIWAERLRLKDRYMNLLLGRRGEERYRNYPVYYRSNTPQQLARLTRQFASLEVVNFSRVGQCNAYYPRCFHSVANCLDRWSIRRGKPGTLLAVRVVK
jgi:SAM-dependent methyltransferase